MPRLFLDVADEDEVIPDAEGIAFSDAEVAIEEAARGARANWSRTNS
jgi:hypothetical protein